MSLDSGAAYRTLQSAHRWKPWEPVLWVLAFVTPWALPEHALIINEVAIVALFAVSLDLVLGYTGIVSLGHAAFFGVGTYSAALFAKHVMPDPLVGLCVGVVVSTLLGAFCSLSIMRGTDLTRLMVTLGVALILMELANKLDFTGGADGLQGVVMGPVLGRFEFDLYGQTSATYSLCCLSSCGVWCIRRLVPRSRPCETTVCALWPLVFRYISALRSFTPLPRPWRVRLVRCWPKPPALPLLMYLTFTALPT